MIWTDDDVVSRLTKTYARHEGEADADVARRIALATRPAPRRRWPVLAAAAAVVLVVTGLVLVGQRSDPPPGPSHPTVEPEPSTNRDLALAEARRTLRAVPVPSGSRRVAHSPDRSLGHVGCECGEVDRSLTQTHWYVVPLGYRDLARWYAARVPTDAGASFRVTCRRCHLAPTGELDWTSYTGSSAYSNPAIIVGYARLNAHATAIRIDVTLAARFVRAPDTRVPDTVDRIEVVRKAIDGPLTTTGPVTVTRPGSVGAVVTAFDRLSGAYAHTEGLACGSPVGIVYVYTVTFHWPGHVLVVDPGQALCGVGRGLTLDGVRLPQTLDNESDTFDRAVRDALGAT